jgi:DNA-directed RNA polymerase specialized sigma24 family protein
MNLTAITELRRDWERTSHSTRAQTLLFELAAREPDIAAFGAKTLPELVVTGELPAEQSTIESWRITAALLRQFHLDQLVGLSLIVRLSPGLIAMARSFGWGRDAPWADVDAFACDLVHSTWEVLHSLGGSTIAYPERTILRRIYHQLHAQRRAVHRRYAYEELAGEWTIEFADPHPVSVLEELAFALSTKRKMRRQDLQLIYRHRVLGLTFPELAAASGVSVRALEQRSSRAEAALCA